MYQNPPLKSTCMALEHSNVEKRRIPLPCFQVQVNTPEMQFQHSSPSAHQLLPCSRRTVASAGDQGSCLSPLGPTSPASHSEGQRRAPAKRLQCWGGNACISGDAIETRPISEFPTSPRLTCNCPAPSSLASLLCPGATRSSPQQLVSWQEIWQWSQQ